MFRAIVFCPASLWSSRHLLPYSLLRFARLFSLLHVCLLLIFYGCTTRCLWLILHIFLQRLLLQHRKDRPIFERPRQKCWSAIRSLFRPAFFLIRGVKIDACVRSRRRHYLCGEFEIGKVVIFCGPRIEQMTSAIAYFYPAVFDRETVLFFAGLPAARSLPLNRDCQSSSADFWIASTPPVRHATQTTHKNRPSFTSVRLRFSGCVTTYSKLPGYTP